MASCGALGGVNVVLRFKELLFRDGFEYNGALW